MMRTIASSVSTPELLKLAEQGREFECPVCSAVLEKIPEDWKPGHRLIGMACPVSQKHFLIYGEDPEGMDAYRAWIKEVSNKD